MERCRTPSSHRATRNQELAPQAGRSPFRAPSGRRRQGVAMVWVAIFGFVLIGLAGLSVDWGKVAYNVHELQNAADMAALAGAQWVKVNQTTARDRAQQLGLANNTEKIPVQIDRNESNAEAGDLVIGRWDRLARTFTPTLMNPNAVRVVARRITGSPDGPVAMIFGHIAGVETANITREAIGRSIGATGAGIICLDPGKDLGLKVHGNVTLDIQGGDIMVNSSAKVGAVIDGTAGFMNCDLLKVSGGYKLNGVTEEELPFDCVDGVDPAPDPLAALQPPPVYDAANWPWPELSRTDPKKGKLVADTGPRLDASGNPVPFEPGRYSGGFVFTSAGQTMVFKPGVYVVGGQGLQINGGTLQAKGVMFYIETGRVDFGGGGTVLMSPPGEDFTYPSPEQKAMAEYYKDVTIFQARDNYSQARIIGTSTYDIGGILYWPRNELKLEGTAGNTFVAGDQLICWTADIGGSGTLQINYEGQNVIEGFQSVLVR